MTIIINRNLINTTSKMEEEDWEKYPSRNGAGVQQEGMMSHQERVIGGNGWKKSF